MSASVEVDARKFVAGVRQLANGITDGAPPTARKAAEAAAEAIRSRTPVRTGRLASSVQVVTDADGGYGVSYGAGVSYARPVAARTRSVAEGIAGIPDAFARDCNTVADKQIRRL